MAQHLAPAHRSALAEILSRATPMPVMEVQDEPRVQPNHVDVIPPPGRNMTTARGALHLLTREAHGQQRPIDLLVGIVILAVEAWTVWVWELSSC